MRISGLRPALCLFILAVAGCASDVQPPRYPDITFSHLPPIRLDVAEIVYSPRYQPPLDAPNVGQDFPVPPVKAAEQWIRDRLVAVGTQGQARVTIRRATATETKLKVTEGLKGAFTTDQAWRYDANLDVVIDAVNPNRGLKAQATTIAHQSETVPEDASLSEREDVWFAMTEKLMRSFNKTFEAEIRKNLAKFIK